MPTFPPVPDPSSLTSDVVMASKDQTITGVKVTTAGLVAESGVAATPSGVPSGSINGVVMCGPATGVDDTTLVNNAIAAAQALGPGGSVCLWDWNHDYVCLGAIAPAFSGPAGAPVQASVRIFGTTPPIWSGYWAGSIPAGRSVLDLRYAGGDGTHVAKIDTRGAGVLEMDHLTFKSGGADDYLFIQTTNTTVLIHDFAVIGHAANSGTSCVQDFIKLGGSASNVIGNGSDAPFQGYGSKIRDGYFSHIRKGVIPGTYCNNVTIEDLTFSSTCGSSDAQGAPITFAPLAGAGNGCLGNNVRGCLVEATNYRYGVALMNDCYDNLIAGMGLWDVNGYTLGAVYCGASGVNGNIQIAGELSASLTTKYFDGPNALNNMLLVSKSGASSVFPGEVLIGPGAITSTVPGDLTVSRGGASPGTGQISFGSAAAGTHAIQWDGTRFVFTDQVRVVNGIDLVSAGTFNLAPSIATAILVGNTSPPTPVGFNGGILGTKTAPTYSAAITCNLSNGNWQTITVTNGTAFTLNAPTNPPSSSQTAELTIEFLNSSGGAMGVITFNGAFINVGGAFTNPANTKKRYIRYEWNGANWIETGRASADY